MRTHVVICGGCRNRLFIRVGMIDFKNINRVHVCIYCKKIVNFSASYVKSFIEPVNFLDINEWFLDITYKLTAIKYR